MIYCAQDAAVKAPVQTPIGTIAGNGWIRDNRLTDDDLMFKWLAEKFAPDATSAGTLGSARNVRALIEQLKNDTPQSAVRSLGKLFNEIPNHAVKAHGDYRGLMQLDECVQQHLYLLWESLLTDGRGQTVSTAVWDPLVQYYRSVHAGYWYYLASQKLSDKPSQQGHAHAIVNASRAVTALARYMLLLRMRYQDPPQSAWEQLNTLLAWAANRKIETAELEQYPGMEVKTSIEREMLTALLIGVAPTGNLIPSQMHALDRLLRVYMGYYRISDNYDEQARPFGYEPSRNESPRRWLKGLPSRRGVRYFGVGGAYVELCNALEQARSSREVPAWLASTRCNAEDYRELLERLVAEWSLQPPQRRQRRDACDGEILVTYAWGDIQRLIKFGELARSGRSLAYDTAKVYGINSAVRPRMEAPMRDPASDGPTSTQEMLANLVSFEKSLDHDATEPWSLTDMSEGGIGATAAADCTWVRVGMMVAYRRPDSIDWQIAFVRRLNKLASNRLAVGMTKSAGTVSAARLRLGVGSIDYSRAISRNEAVVEYDAVMLQEESCTLLLPIGVVDTNWKYTLTANDRHTIIKMDRSVQRGLNFEQVEISTVEAVRAA